MNNLQAVATVNNWLQITGQHHALPQNPTRDQVYALYKLQAHFLTRSPCEAGDVDLQVFEALEWLEQQAEN